jgi:hypothetical protein
MSRKIRARPWLLGVPVGVALVASIMVPLALAQSRPASVVAQTTQGAPECTERNLDFPLEVNVEETGPRFKTIAMEKEVFYCGEGPQEVRDVELFVETVETVLKDPLRVRHIETRVEAATCVKRFSGGFKGTGVGGFAECEARNVPVQEISPEESGELIGACTLNEEQPADPVAMATTETEGVVKTVNVEKERMFCDFSNGKGAVGPFGGSTFQGEVFLFTEILEANRRVTINGAQVTSIRPIDKRFIAVICEKDPNDGFVRGCVTFDPEVEPKGD